MKQQRTLKVHFNKAIELINSGNAVAAEELCRKAIERNPRDVTMLGLLGAVLVSTRQLEPAREILEKTIQLAPTFAKAHDDLGYVLLELGHHAEAVKVLRKAVRLDPGLDFAHLNLGKALAASGLGKEADAAFEASFELCPERKTLAMAVKHHKEGNLDKAERLYKLVLKKRPKNVDALRMLAVLAAAANKPDDAERLLQRAIKIAPDYLAAVLDLGRILKEQERFGEAIECFQKAIEINPKNPLAHYYLAATYSPAALNHEAVKEYQRTLDLAPEHPGALLGLGNSLKTIGKSEAAIKAYQKCISVKPQNGEVYWSLANLKTYQFNEDQIEEMKSRISGADEITDASKVNFLFALGKAHDDRNMYEQAWHYYERANNQHRMMVRYDAAQTETVNDAVIEVFNQELLEEKNGLGLDDPAPIFVLGLPRSGSTLLEQILASHSQVEGTSELPYIGRVALSLNRNRADGINYPHAVKDLGEIPLKALGEDYLDYARLHRTGNTPFFIDKMPNNFPSIGFIHLILPNAKIIDARRHPLDACVANYRQHYARGQTFAYDLVDLGEYYLEYQRMMDHWHEVLPGRILTVQYEDVVTDLENQVRRILEYCGLPWEDACVNFHQTSRPVRTASSEQVRQPIYTKAVNFWRNYEEHLGELITIIEPLRPRYEKYESINRAG